MSACQGVIVGSGATHQLSRRDERVQPGLNTGGEGRRENGPDPEQEKKKKPSGRAKWRRSAVHNARGCLQADGLARRRG